MIPSSLQVTGIVCSLAYLLLIVFALLRSRLSVRHSLAWLASAALFLAVSVFPGVLLKFSALLGFATPSNALLLIWCLTLTLLIFAQTRTSSRQSDDIRNLAQAMAILRIEQEQLAGSDGGASIDPPKRSISARQADELDYRRARAPDGEGSGMRVLFVTEFFPLLSEGIFEITGGLEAAALACARHMAKEHHIRVLTDSRTACRAFSHEGIEVLQCGRLGKYTQTGALLHRASFQRQAVGPGVDFRPDVVVGWNFIAYSPAFQIARQCGVPAIAWYADVWVGRWLKLFGLKGLLGEILERRVLRRKWDTFIAISDFTRTSLLEQGIPADRVEVIPPIVDVSAVEAASPPAEKSIIVASRLVQYKRVDVALRAIARLVHSHPDLRLSVLGHGPERPALERLAVELGIAERIVWHGWLRDHGEVLRLMAGHQLYINASQVEGFGISTIEAAGLGVPYVASDIPAIRYATRGGQGGILFEPGDDRACAEALDGLLGDRVVYEGKRSEGRALAREYSPAVLGPVFERCLAQAVSAHRGTAGMNSRASSVVAPSPGSG